MSATKLVPLDFSMSFEDLSSTCVEKEAYLTTDQAALAKRGITVDMITNCEAARVAFVALPSNATEVANSTKAFKARNKQAVILKTALNIVLNIAEDTYTTDSPEYKMFDVKRLSKYNSKQLVNTSPNVVLQGMAYMAEMSVKGLTTDMLTNITTQAAILGPLISATHPLVVLAEAATQTRRKAANALYAIIKPMCNTAHAYFLSVGNKLNAENYVIYDVASNVVERVGTVKPTKSATRKTTGVVATTRIRLKVNSGKSLQFYYGMTKTSLPTASATTVLYNPNIFLTTTVAGLGYDLAGGIIHFIIRNPNADDSDFLAKIG